MTRVGHLVEADGAWEDWQGVATLLSRIPPARIEQRLATLGAPPEQERLPLGAAPTMLGARLGAPVLAAPRVARWLTDGACDLIHAWGRRAMRAAHIARRSDIPLTYTCHDPAVDRRTVAALRLFCAQGPTAVVCSAQRVFRRLVEQGVPMDRCVVIRPPVDFARINAARGGDLRARMGLDPMHRAVLLAPAAGARSGDATFDAAWAILVLGLIDDRIRLIVRADGWDARRVIRLGRGSYEPATLVVARPDASLVDLVSVSQALLWPDDGDASTALAAWAMAAGTLIVGAAGYALSELIAHRHNGLLYKRNASTGVVPAICQCFVTDTDDVRLMTEAARGHAFDVFGQKRFVDQHLRLYDNLLSARAPADGIVDSAVVA